MQVFKKNYIAIGSGITLAVALGLHAGPGSAAGGAEQPAAGSVTAAAPDAVPPSPAAVQGMRVYRDPRTGQLGPPPPGAPPLELSPAERRMLNRSDRGLQSHTLPGGGVAVNLQGRYRNMAVATVGADGQAAVNCAVTPAQAEAVLQAGQQGDSGTAD